MIRDMHALDWLLEDDAPGVAYLARRRLLGESPTSRRMAGLGRDVLRFSAVSLRRPDQPAAKAHAVAKAGAHNIRTGLGENSARFNP